MLGFDSAPEGIHSKHYNQVDLLKLKPGQKLEVGTVLKSSMIEDLYDIKASANGTLTKRQAEALNRVLNFGNSGTPRQIKVAATDFHWSTKQNKLMPTSHGSQIRSIRVGLYAIGAVQAFHALQQVAEGNDNIGDELSNLQNRINEISTMPIPNNEKEALAVTAVSSIVSKYDPSTAGYSVLQGWFYWELSEKE